MLTISYGQALLLMIDYYQSQKVVDEVKISACEKFYLSGPKDYSPSTNLNEQKEKDKKLRENLDDLIKEGERIGVLRGYRISSDPRIIDEDTSRRTFENALAYETLCQSLKELNLQNLKDQFTKIYMTIQKKSYKTQVHYSLELAKKLNGLYGNEYAKLINTVEEPISKEFIDAVCTINSPENFVSLSSHEKEILTQLMWNALASFWLLHDKSDRYDSLPLDVYRTHEYFNSGRGREAKTNQDNLLSRHPGLYRSYHPSPKESLDQVENRYERKLMNQWVLKDIKTSHEKSDRKSSNNKRNKLDPDTYRGPFPRAADRSRFNLQGSWVRDSFALLVHPFSASISGSMLYQLRVFLYLQSIDQFKFGDSRSMCAYLKCFISGLLYTMGGHSYNEFMAVCALKEVQDAFKFVGKLEDENSPITTFKNSTKNSFFPRLFSEMNLDTLFRQSNKIAFKKAIAEAIKYNKLILNKARLHQSIINSPKPFLFKYLNNRQAKDVGDLFVQLEKKNDIKINKVLNEYITEKFIKIESFVKKQKLSPTDLLKIQINLLKSLIDIDFVNAYQANLFQSESKKGEIDYNQFVKFLEGNSPEDDKAIPLVVLPEFMLTKEYKIQAKKR